MWNNLVISIKKAWKKVNPFRDDWDTDSDEVEEDDEPYIPPPVTIMERAGWNAKKPKWRRELKTPVTTFVMRYFSDTDYCWDDEECIKVVRGLQDQHMSMGMPDIAWNFVIGCHGTVYEGRGWTTDPTKTDYQSLQYDGQTIDVALIGDFNYYHPTSETNKAMCRLMRKGVELGYATEGWELIELRDLPPHAPWTPEYFMKNDVPSERIYDDTTEPPPSAAGGPSLAMESRPGNPSPGK